VTRYLVNGFGAVHGGIVRVHNAICLELAERGDVSIASAPRDQVAAARLNIMSVQSGGRARSLLRDAVLAGRRRERFDVRVDSAPALRPFTRARRHIVVVHDLNFLRPDIHEISWKQRTYRRLLHRWTLRRADRIVVNSEQTLAELTGFDPRSAAKAVVLRLPVDHVAGTTPEGRLDRSSKKGTAVLSFGHARNKGIDRLLYAMCERSDLTLDVICPQATWGELWAELARHLGLEARVRVHSLVSDDDLIGCYLAADVFCMLSRYEGYGLPVAEALYLATPTVISDLAVLRETSLGFAEVADGPGADAVLQAIERALSTAPQHWLNAAGAFRQWTWGLWVDRLLAVG